MRDLPVNRDELARMRDRALRRSDAAWRDFSRAYDRDPRGVVVEMLTIEARAAHDVYAYLCRAAEGLEP